MTELRFDKSVYAAAAIDEAIGLYASYATLEKSDADGAVVVKVTGKTDSRERKVAGEFANHALGRTIQAGKK